MKVISSESKKTSGLGGFKELSYTNKEAFNDFKKVLKNVLKISLNLIFRYFFMIELKMKPKSHYLINSY